MLCISGEFQSTQYDTDGIIVPRLFYKARDDVKDTSESIDIFEQEEKEVKEKECLENIEDLSHDMDILDDKSSHKIVSEVYLKPNTLIDLNKNNKIRFKNPIIETPERPLSASYQPSVPVVQVTIKYFKIFFIS